MQSLYILRTAAVASLTAAFVTFGWMTMGGDELQIASEPIVASSVQAEPAMHFHAYFVLQANPDEAEVREYYRRPSPTRCSRTSSCCAGTSSPTSNRPNSRLLLRAAKAALFLATCPWRRRAWRAPRPRLRCRDPLR